MFLKMSILPHELPLDPQHFMDELCRTVPGIERSTGDLGPSRAIFPALMTDTLPQTRRVPFLHSQLPTKLFCGKALPSYSGHRPFINQINLSSFALTLKTDFTIAIFSKVIQTENPNPKKSCRSFPKVATMERVSHTHNIILSTVAMGIQSFVSQPTSVRRTICSVVFVSYPHTWHITVARK